MRIAFNENDVRGSLRFIRESAVFKGVGVDSLARSEAEITLKLVSETIATLDRNYLILRDDKFVKSQIIR